MSKVTNKLKGKSDIPSPQKYVLQHLAKFGAKETLQSDFLMQITKKSGLFLYTQCETDLTLKLIGKIRKRR